MQVYVDLLSPITPRHFYNEDIGQRERNILGEAYQRRIQKDGDPAAAARGVLKVVPLHRTVQINLL
jgi:hypothetical protein